MSDLEKKFVAALEGLKKKDVEPTLRELVERNKVAIGNARSRGWTFEDIAASLGENGISIRPGTLKGYWNAASETEPRVRRKRGGSESKTPVVAIAATHTNGAGSNGAKVIAIPPVNGESEHAAHRNLNREA
jgi:hypothetical protein